MAVTNPIFVQGSADRLPFRNGIFRCVVESPPYFGLRWYGDSIHEPGRRGLADYIEEMVEHGKEVARVLVDSEDEQGGGTWWLNIGDTAANSGGAGGDHQRGGGKESINFYKQGNMGIKGNQWGLVPWRVVMALQDDGWYLRSHVVWDKGDRKPESLLHVRRPGVQWEPIFMLVRNTKSYVFDPAGLIQPGNVWNFGTSKGKAHQAPFPDELPRRCIGISSIEGDNVLDCYSGSGTTANVAYSMGRQGYGVELYRDVVRDAYERDIPLFDTPSPTTARRR